MALLPAAFLFRVAYTCPHVETMPRERGELTGLPESARLVGLGAMDDKKEFADIRVGWNENGLGFRIEVRGKKQPLQCDAGRAFSSDGVSLWIDTRDSRESHRASRHCHQFHLLPAGGGSELDEAIFLQAKIHRAQQDAPSGPSSAVRFRSVAVRGGYIIETFLPAAALNGFDPEQNRKLGLFYCVRDLELGDQTPGLGADFPYHEDPSLWCVLELAS